MNKTYTDKFGQTARVVLASRSPQGIPLISFETHYWRPIHSELKTHRSFSGNSRSSRAVPVTRLLKEPIFLPHLMQNRPGMTAITELPRKDYLEAMNIWSTLAQTTRDAVERLHALDVHKQWANRPLEWFGWIDSLYTSTDWANFYALRLDGGAQPELRTLAKIMYQAAQECEWQYLKPGEWHLPYISDEDWDEARRSVPDEFDYDQVLEAVKLISTARCARVSIKPFDGNADYVAEKLRIDRLLTSPVHASPFEHQATPDKQIESGMYAGDWDKPHLHGNFDGWIQHRKLIPNEQVRDR